MSADSLETIRPSSLSHRTGTQTRPSKLGIGGVVGLLEELEAVDLVGEAAAGEGPAALVAVGVGVGDADSRGR